MKAPVGLLLSAFMLSVIFSCSLEPQPIRYGHDQCHFCKMNIVDKAHSAQHVTDKGKQYKYDAIECMIRYTGGEGEGDIAIIKVADFGNPGQMIDAADAKYLVSPGIKSPMGANLSALSDLARTKELQAEYGGEIFDWNGIRSKILSR